MLYVIISRFPELVFCTPSMRNKSEIVFVEDLPHTSLLEHNTSDYDNSEIEIEDNNDDSDTYYMESEPETDPVPLLAHLHRAALYVRNLFKTNSFQPVWPPLSNELDMNSVKSMVPIPLFNFFVWMLGFSDEPVSEYFINVKNNEYIKIMSVIQDCIYISSKGFQETPKTLALSMAVRQITGSKKLTDILSGFGHTAKLALKMQRQKRASAGIQSI